MNVICYYGEKLWEPNSIKIYTCEEITVGVFIISKITDNYKKLLLNYLIFNFLNYLIVFKSS